MSVEFYPLQCGGGSFIQHNDHIGMKLKCGGRNLGCDGSLYRLGDHLRLLGSIGQQKATSSLQNSAHTHGNGKPGYILLFLKETGVVHDRLLIQRH